MDTGQPVQSPETQSSSGVHTTNPRARNGGREGGRRELVTVKCKRTGEEFTSFFGRHTVLSQWHPCTFKVDGVEYNCAEQYMMHKKVCEYITGMFSYCSKVCAPVL